MLEPFQLPFVQRGIVEVLILAVAGGLIGTWIVLRGLAFYAHAVGTAAFPGLVLADGLGFAAVLGAGASAAVVALAVAVLARRERASDRYDAITALVLVAALALGVILASDVFHSGSNVETLLFGSLLLVDWGDVAFAAVAAVVVVAGTFVLEQRWLARGFDAGSARALGVRSAVPDTVLLGLVALVAVAALSTLGALLATALLVVPAATTRLVCSRLRAWQLATVALVAVEGVAGLWLSVEVNAPPGPAIAVLAGGVFVLVALRRMLLVPAVAAALLVAGCGTDSGPAGPGQTKVIATTTQLGDFARAVGGDRAKVVQLLKPNTDPHDYEPRPHDVLDTANAEVVLENGDGLDHWMGDVIDQAGSDAAVVDLGARVPVRAPGDPHWWHDPRNAEAAVVAIRDALTKANPDAKDVYARNAASYLRDLRALDRGIAACVARVPAAQRKLVTDHDAFNYFARRYGIEVVGAVIPSQTTQAQPSAGDVARLTRLIRREGVKAVFPESSINPKLAKAIASQTGATSDLELYGDTLGPKGSAGATYLGMEQANADAMVRGFTGGAQRCAIPGL
ncbi:MAG TPA: zinc ABC transporter substrate-binding protein [Solirubrobacteraceae bacterium]|nr:zinc ABC transporter substrate-binding protein [Solirubrobacteraceae bacterium]